MQDPKTTTYDTMPRNAIATGVVDAIATVEDLPDLIIHYLTNNYTATPAEANSLSDQNNSGLLSSAFAE